MSILLLPDHCLVAILFKSLIWRPGIHSNSPFAKAPLPKLGIQLCNLCKSCFILRRYSFYMLPALISTALHRQIRSLAVEWVQFARLSCIYPGIITTPTVESFPLGTRSENPVVPFLNLGIES